MGYVIPPLPKNASPAMREAYLRHLLKALAVSTNPWRDPERTPIAKWLDEHPQPLISHPELKTEALAIADPPRWWKRRRRNAKP